MNLFRSWLSVPVLTSPRRYCLLMFSNSMAVMKGNVKKI